MQVLHPLMGGNSYLLLAAGGIHLSAACMMFAADTRLFNQPFQIWATLKWLSIPATVLAVRRLELWVCSPHLTLMLSEQSFIFFGFLVAGEEIESKLLLSCVLA